MNEYQMQSIITMEVQRAMLIKYMPDLTTNIHYVPILYNKDDSRLLNVADTETILEGVERITGRANIGCAYADGWCLVVYDTVKRDVELSCDEAREFLSAVNERLREAVD